MVMIRRLSWHYRLVEETFGANNIPQHLCPYFWTVVSALFRSGAKYLEE